MYTCSVNENEYEMTLFKRGERRCDLPVVLLKPIGKSVHSFGDF